MRKNQNKQNAPTRHFSWWKTDCAVCQRIRLYVLWALIMLVVYLYVWQ